MRVAYICPNEVEEIAVLTKEYANLTRHVGDAGLDLFALTDTDVGVAGTLSKIDLGFSMVIVDEGKEPIAFQLLARSSTHKLGIMQANCVGIVDAGYRGNLMVPVLTFGHDCAGTISKYSRLFQAVPFDGKGVDHVVFVTSQTMLETMFPSSRGIGGFGSTGSGGCNEGD